MVFRTYRSYRTKRSVAKASLQKKNRVKRNRSDLTAMKKRIASLEGKLNVEKKRHRTSVYTQSFGQVNGATSDGGIYFEITPTPASGSGAEERTGASIELKSMFIAMQMWGQTTQTHKMKVKLDVVQTSDGDALTYSEIFNPNQFVADANSGAIIYDTASYRHPDYLNKYKFIRSMWVTLDEDSYSGQTNIVSRSLKLNFGKNGKHIQFSKDTTTPTNTRLWLLVRADSGNMSGTACTLTNVPVTGASTGANFAYSAISYYIDN